MEALYDIIEGMFDDTLDDQVTGAIADGWIKDNAKGDFKIIKTKKGNKISGDITFKNVKGFMPLDIIDVRGSFSVINCDIEDFRVIFQSDMTKVTGNFTVAGCDKLTSLDGMPYFIDGQVSISECPNLKDLGDAKCLSSHVSIMKCKGGRRFSKSAVEKNFPAATRIFCSEEEELANINEAMRDPVLIRLIKQLKDDKKKYNIRDMLQGYNQALDQIDQSYCKTFIMPNDQKEMLKAARRVVGNYANSSSGFIVVENLDNEFTYVYNTHGYRYDLKYTSTSYYRKDYEHWSVNDIMDELKDIHSGTVYVYSDMSDLETYKKRVDRSKSREGMINTDKGSLQRILDDQKDRYRRIVKKIKAERGSEKYQSIVKLVDGIMVRFSKFMHKYISDNSYAQNVGYKSGEVFDSIRRGYVNNTNTQRYGVIYCFQNWSSALVKTLAGKGSSYDTSSLDGYQSQLKKAIEWADKALSDVGM